MLAGLLLFCVDASVGVRARCGCTHSWHWSPLIPFVVQKHLPVNTWHTLAWPLHLQAGRGEKPRIRRAHTETTALLIRNTRGQTCWRAIRSSLQSKHLELTTTWGHNKTYNSPNLCCDNCFYTLSTCSAVSLRVLFVCAAEDVSVDYLNREEIDIDPRRRQKKEKTVFPKNLRLLIHKKWQNSQLCVYKKQINKHSKKCSLPVNDSVNVNPLWFKFRFPHPGLKSSKAYLQVIKPIASNYMLKLRSVH